MRKSAAMMIACAVVLSGCGSGSVYDRDIPSADDRSALLEIRDGLKDEDQDAWRAIVMSKSNPMAEPIRSKTVGEAIEKMKRKRDCLKTHELKQHYDSVDEQRKDIDAIEECDKLPV